MGGISFFKKAVLWLSFAALIATSQPVNATPNKLTTPSNPAKVSFDYPSSDLPQKSTVLITEGAPVYLMGTIPGYTKNNRVSWTYPPIIPPVLSKINVVCEGFEIDGSIPRRKRSFYGVSASYTMIGEVGPYKIFRVDAIIPMQPCRRLNLRMYYPGDPNLSASRIPLITSILEPTYGMTSFQVMIPIEYVITN